MKKYLKKIQWGFHACCGGAVKKPHPFVDAFINQVLLWQVVGSATLI